MHLFLFNQRFSTKKGMLFLYFGIFNEKSMLFLYFYNFWPFHDNMLKNVFLNTDFDFVNIKKCMTQMGREYPLIFLGRFFSLKIVSFLGFWRRNQSWQLHFTAGSCVSERAGCKNGPLRKAPPNQIASFSLIKNK